MATSKSARSGKERGIAGIHLPVALEYVEPDHSFVEGRICGSHNVIVYMLLVFHAFQPLSSKQSFGSHCLHEFQFSLRGKASAVQPSHCPDPVMRLLVSLPRLMQAYRRDLFAQTVSQIAKHLIITVVLFAGLKEVLRPNDLQGDDRQMPEKAWAIVLLQ